MAPKAKTAVQKHLEDAPGSRKPGLIQHFVSFSNPEVTYDIRRGGDGVVYCSCPSWKYQRKPSSLRVCKHILALAEKSPQFKNEFSVQINAALGSAPAAPKAKVIPAPAPKVTAQPPVIPAIRDMTLEQLAVVLQAVQLRVKELQGAKSDHEVATPAPTPVAQGSTRLGATVEWLTKQGQTKGVIIRLTGKEAWVRTPDGVVWRMPMGMLNAA